MKKLKGLLLPLGVVIVLAIVVVAVLPRVAPGLVKVEVGGAKTEAAAASPQATEALAPPVHVPLSLGERVVNLADPGGYRFLKAEIVIELTVPAPSSNVTSDDIARLQSNLGIDLESLQPELQDVLTTVLSEKTVADIATIAGKDTLRQQLLEEIQAVFDKRKLEFDISAIYLTQFVMQ